MLSRCDRNVEPQGLNDSHPLDKWKTEHEKQIKQWIDLRQVLSEAIFSFFPVGRWSLSFKLGFLSLFIFVWNCLIKNL